MTEPERTKIMRSTKLICSDLYRYYIGPIAALVEAVMISNNVMIGAGAVVTRSIPEYATSAGNPARVLNQIAPGRYVNNRWPIKPE